MKKIFYMLVLVIFLVGCDSLTLKGEHGIIQIEDSCNHKWIKSNGNAFGHKKHKNPYYHPYCNVGVSSSVHIYL